MVIARRPECLCAKRKPRSACASYAHQAMRIRPWTIDIRRRWPKTFLRVAVVRLKKKNWRKWLLGVRRMLKTLYEDPASGCRARQPRPQLARAAVARFGYRVQSLYSKPRARHW